MARETRTYYDPETGSLLFDISGETFPDRLGEHWIEGPMPEHSGLWRVADGALVRAPEADEIEQERLKAHIDQERDRRTDAGFVFEGVHYQSRPEDRENIIGAAAAALGAMIAGAQPGDLRWHGGDSDFRWIATDNSETPMDAQTVYRFGQAAMAHKQAHIFAGRGLKDMQPIPADYADDQYWP